MACAPQHLDLHDLKAAPWLRSRPLIAVMDALGADKGETRIIGGAVRNALLGEPVSDIDLATVHVPETVIARATKAGLNVHPTGLEHGTVTVVADGHPFEVTTLRRDVETDGRRAVVAFTTDWHEDALRRDFTINALSADAAGTVFDSVGGVADLSQRRVRFIGSANDRISEDYLRILRFFRFTSAYAVGAPDADGLQASIALKAGLSQLSAERIGAEMMKLIVTPRAAEIAALMDGGGILSALVALPARPADLANLQHIERALHDAADPITRMAALFLGGPEDAQTLAQAFRLSTAETSALRLAAKVNASHFADCSDDATKAAIYRSGGLAFRRAQRVAWALSGAPATDPAWTAKARLAAHWSPPAMPFSGNDVLALGVPAGPRVGRTLKAFEAWWIEAGFPADSGLQHARLAALAAQS